jgi:hypothetical protein
MCQMIVATSSGMIVTLDDFVKYCANVLPGLVLELSGGIFASG